VTVSELDLQVRAGVSESDSELNLQVRVRVSESELDLQVRARVSESEWARVSPLHSHSTTNTTSACQYNLKDWVTIPYFINKIEKYIIKHLKHACIPNSLPKDQNPKIDLTIQVLVVDELDLVTPEHDYNTRINRHDWVTT